ncbi:MAG: sel1 repeat family protein [Rhodospirillales bacterium]|nr:sel1 repeat family protein [Rhodospirillales bacterium]
MRGQGVKPDRAEALRLYRAAAERGDGETMNAIGYNYEYGNTLVPRDIETAVYWYCRAIERGNPRAMNNLGLLFAAGEGAARDLSEAHSLWRQAAEAGHSNSMVNLGLSLLENGQKSRIAWLRRAAELGSGAAQAQLARMGIHGVWPHPFDDATRMTLEPDEPPAGHSRYCRPLVS